MHMNNSKISIIVPIYNVEPFLEKCIESLLNQTYKNIEIILVDDGSSDKCPEICDLYSKRDERIKVIHKENGGLSDARNYGLDISTGEYVTFVDSDDYVENDYIEFLYNLLIQNNTDVSVCAYNLKKNDKIIFSQENGKIERLSVKDYIEKLLYHDHTNASACAKLYKKSLYDDIQFPKGKLFEDTLTTYKVILKSNGVALGLIAKYNYIMRKNSIMTSEFSEKKAQLINATEEMNDNILKEFPNLKTATIRMNVYARISVLRQMIFCKPRLKKREQKYRKYIKENSKIILKDKKAPKRDKIAIILISINMNLFKLLWIIYCKITGRTE